MKKIWLLTTLLVCGLLLAGCHNPLKDVINPIEWKSYTDIAQICEDNDWEITTDELWNDICLFNALDRCLLEKIQDWTCEFLKQCEWEDCEIQESVTQEIEPDSVVIYWWKWTHEIVGDKTVYYNENYWITLRVGEKFNWWIIIESDNDSYYTIDENTYTSHDIHFMLKDDNAEDGYLPAFLITVIDNDNVSSWDNDWKNSIIGQNDKYTFIKSSTDDQRYTDLHIFDISNIEKNWENQCISGLHDWLKNMEPNWVFSEIVWNNDNWENAFKVDWMNMKTKSWIMYYTNDNTKRKLDFQCRAEVEAASTSTSFWNVEFVE